MRSFLVERAYFILTEATSHVAVIVLARGQISLFFTSLQRALRRLLAV
jgi:hypothetical protein